MDDRRWRDLESMAERLNRLAENQNIPYHERDQIKRDAIKISEEANKQRDVYVRWLWGR